MWLTTTVGAFTLAQKPADLGRDTLTIRGRSLADMTALRDLYLPGLQIRTMDSSDYRYHATVSRERLQAAVGAMVADVTYRSLRAAVRATQGPERAFTYASAWVALARIQEEEGHPPVPTLADDEPMVCDACGGTVVPLQETGAYECVRCGMPYAWDSSVLYPEVG